MKFTEEQIKDIIALKDSLAAQMDRHHRNIIKLEKNITILDSILKESSFTKASHLDLETPKDVVEQEQEAAQAEHAPQQEPQAEHAPQQLLPSIPIKKGNTDVIIANAHIAPDSISVILEDGARVSADTPPFKSFFLDRIIAEMKAKDLEEVKHGNIQKEEVIECVVGKDGENIKEITIKNYRLEERAKDLINTVGWSLSRMLEKIKK